MEGWKAAKQQHHPRVRLRIATNKADYLALGIVYPKIAPTHVDVVTDSGAQSCLWGVRSFIRCGFKMTDLVQVHHRMSAANKQPIQIDGAIVLRLSGEGEHGTKYECAVMVFVSPQTEDFFLSKEAMQQLAIIPKDFPRVGAADVPQICNIQNPSPVEDTVNNLAVGAKSTICDCLQRSKPPGIPKQLPMECKPENIEKFEKWCKEQYASSTFNKCPHQTLPELNCGPHMKIHVDPDVEPVVDYKPSVIPLHVEEQVIADLRRDIAMGVLEPAPMNEPVTWCHRMVISVKPDGKGRRTIDLSTLNKHCKREPHGSKTPFQMAKSIPPNTWKTVQDSWNGYHTIPIRKEDRHLTTFQSPIGRLRYTRAPQGAL